jgi:hypothetical protein
MAAVLPYVRPLVGAAPPKALYLSSREPLHIALQGESLLVRRQAGERRFPLARIDRIVCNRHAQWSGEAITACLARGITVTWLDGRGRALGECACRRAAPVPFVTRLESYLELSDWPQRYGNWLRRRRLDVLARWARRRTACGHPPEVGVFESYKRSFVYGNGALLCADDLAEGWSHALAVGCLAREGLACRYWGCGGEALELADDLGRLLWAEFSLECGTAPAAAEPAPVKLLFFEQWAGSGQVRIVEHLADLKRHVARELEAWQ